MSAYAGFVSYAVIIIEILIATLLSFEKSRTIGLYAATALMTSFTAYIFLILNYSDFVPCSCGGILEKLGWTEHLIFNLICVLSGIVAIHFAGKISLKNSKAVFLGMFTCNIFSFALVIILFFISESITKNANNFTRRYLQHPVTLTNEYKLEANSFYIAGVTKDRLYLGNKTAPFLVTSLPLNLNSIHKKVVFPNSKNTIYKNLGLKFDGQFFYLHDGSVPIILRGKVDTKKCTTISFKEAYFTQLTIINDDLFAFKSQSPKDKNVVLGILNTKSGKINLCDVVKQNKSSDYFANDGLLINDPITKKLIYIYYYNSQYLILDETLNLIKIQKTISSTTNADKLGVRKSDGEYKLGIPLSVINRQAIVYNGVLFNLSYERGKFEDEKIINKNFILDLYNIETGEYIGSMIIAKKEKEKRIQFLANGNQFYVLRDNKIQQFSFSKNITKHFQIGEAENLKE